MTPLISPVLPGSPVLPPVLGSLVALGSALAWVGWVVGLLAEKEPKPDAEVFSASLQATRVRDSGRQRRRRRADDKGCMVNDPPDLRAAACLVSYRQGERSVKQELVGAYWRADEG